MLQLNPARAVMLRTGMEVFSLADLGLFDYPGMTREGTLHPPEWSPSSPRSPRGSPNATASEPNGRPTSPRFPRARRV